VHGVSAKKIKHILSTYEHNITAESLFAMLPPLICGRQSAPATISSGSDDATDRQSQTSTVNNLCSVPSSSMLSTSDAEAAVIVTEDVKCMDVAGTDRTCCSSAELESENVTHAQRTDVLVCCTESDAAADTDSISLDQPHDTDTHVSLGPSDTLDPIHSALSTITQTSHGLDALDPPHSRNTQTSCGSNTMDPVHSIDVQTSQELDTLDPLHTADTLMSHGPDKLDHSTDTETSHRPHTQMTQGPDTLDSVSTYTQTSHGPDKILLTSSATDEVSTAESVALSNSELDDEACCRCVQHLTETFSEVKLACSEDETLDCDHIHSNRERLKHSAADKTQCLSPDLTDVKHSENNKIALHTVTTETVLKKDQESEVHNGDNDTDKCRTSELYCKTEKLSGVSDEQLLSEVTADHVDSDVSLQPRHPETDCFLVNETKIKSAETQRYNATRDAELVYWGQTNIEHSEAEVLPRVVDIMASNTLVTDSLAEQYVSGTQPKPQRMKLQNCEKRPISSLSETILAGKEWVNECGRGWNPSTQLSDSSSPHTELCCVNTDTDNVEQCSVSSDYQMNSTQTEPNDFITLTKVMSGDEVVDKTIFVAIVETSPRVVSLCWTDNQTLPTIPYRSLLHKSCSTTDLTESVDSSSQLDFLASCFPTISSRDLRELLENCGNDVVVAADLLFEFGYEYNEPRDDVTDISSSSTSCTDSAVSSPENSSPTGKRRSGKNISAHYRLYRDMLMPKSVRLQSSKMLPQCEVRVPDSLSASSLCPGVCSIFSACLRIFITFCIIDICFTSCSM